MLNILMYIEIVEHPNQGDLHIRTKWLKVSKARTFSLSVPTIDPQPPPPSPPSSPLTHPWPQPLCSCFTPHLPLLLLQIQAGLCREAELQKHNAELQQSNERLRQERARLQTTLRRAGADWVQLQERVQEQQQVEQELREEVTRLRELTGQRPPAGTDGCSGGGADGASGSVASPGAPPLSLSPSALQEPPSDEDAAGADAAGGARDVTGSYAGDPSPAPPRPGDPPSASVSVAGPSESAGQPPPRDPPPCDRGSPGGRPAPRWESEGEAGEERARGRRSPVVATVEGATPEREGAKEKRLGQVPGGDPGPDESRQSPAGEAAAAAVKRPAPPSGGCSKRQKLRSGAPAASAASDAAPPPPTVEDLRSLLAALARPRHLPPELQLVAATPEWGQAWDVACALAAAPPPAGGGCARVWAEVEAALQPLPTAAVLVALRSLLRAGPAPGVLRHAVECLLGALARRATPAPAADWRDVLEALVWLAPDGAIAPLSGLEWAHMWGQALPDLLPMAGAAGGPVRAALGGVLRTLPPRVVVAAVERLLRARAPWPEVVYPVAVLGKVAEWDEAPERGGWCGAVDAVLQLYRQGRLPVHMRRPEWHAALGAALGGAAYHCGVATVAGVRRVCALLTPRGPGGAPEPEGLLGPAWALACLALHNAPALQLLEPPRAAFNAALAALRAPDFAAGGRSTHQCGAVAASALAATYRQREEAVQRGVVRPLLQWLRPGGGGDAPTEHERATHVLTGLYNLVQHEGLWPEIGGTIRECAPGLVGAYLRDADHKRQYCAAVIGIVLELLDEGAEREARHLLGQPLRFGAEPRPYQGWSAAQQQLLEEARATIDAVVYETRPTDFMQRSADPRFRLAAIAGPSVTRLVATLWDETGPAGIAAWVLGYLVWHEGDELLHVHVALAGAVPALIALLRTGGDDARAYAALAVANLAAVPAHQPALGAAVADLVRILRLDVHPLGVKEDAALALLYLSRCGALCQTIVEAGALDALDALVRHHGSDRAIETLEALRCGAKAEAGRRAGAEAERTPSMPQCAPTATPAAMVVDQPGVGGFAEAARRSVCRVLSGLECAGDPSLCAARAAEALRVGAPAAASAQPWPWPLRLRSWKASGRHHATTLILLEPAPQWQGAPAGPKVKAEPRAAGGPAAVPQVRDAQNRTADAHASLQSDQAPSSTRPDSPHVDPNNDPRPDPTPGADSTPDSRPAPSPGPLPSDPPPSHAASGPNAGASAALAPTPNSATGDRRMAFEKTFPESLLRRIAERTASCGRPLQGLVVAQIADGAAEPQFCISNFASFIGHGDVVVWFVDAATGNVTAQHQHPPNANRRVFFVVLGVNSLAVQS